MFARSRMAIKLAILIAGRKQLLPVTGLLKCVPAEANPLKLANYERSI